jgi:hypothetical protein
MGRSLGLSPRLWRCSQNRSRARYRVMAVACEAVDIAAWLRLSFEKFDIFHSGLALIFAGEREHFVCHEAVGFARRANPTRRKQYVNTAARAEIQDIPAALKLAR